MDKRFKTIEQRLSRYEISPSGCWEWTGATLWNGYGRLHNLNGNHLAHRASYSHHVGPIPEGALVLHSCDNRKCINPAHLRLGSHSDNNNDAYQRGRRPDYSGERNPFAKLTAEQVETIRADERPQTVLAKEYRVSTSLISAIKCNDAWRTANATNRAKMGLR